MANSTLSPSLKKWLPTILALVITAGFVALFFVNSDLADSSTLTSLEKTLLDSRFRFRGVRQGGNEVVIVGVEDKTLAKLGSMRVFQRNNWADLIAKLAATGPSAIGFDITFQDPDLTDPANDRKFADAMQAANNVVLGLQINLEPRQGPRRREEALDAEMEKLVTEKQIFAVDYHPPGGRPDLNAFRGKDISKNLPELTKAALAFGFVNFHSDADGRLRYQPQVIDFGGRWYPSLDIQLLRKYLNEPTSAKVNYNVNGNIESVDVGTLRIPTDTSGRVLMNYNGPRGTYQTVPMIDVMEGSVSPEVFKDKIVLIGAPTVGLNDVVASPFDPVLPGIELHANFLDNVLHSRFLLRDGRAKAVDIALIIVFGIVLGYFLPKLNAVRSLIYTALILAAFVAFNLWAFVQLQWFLSLVYPGSSMITTAAVLIGYKYFTEERERNKTKNTFQLYLDQHVIEQVLNNQQMLRLGGEKRELTVLFSDIRGFTSFSEKMAPAEVVHFLNQYFEKMQGIIFHNKGTLDKLIGDAVMCFWGAPLPMKDHPLRGVTTALEMIQAVEDLRSILVLPGGAKFEIGVGLNTGDMVVGNMGSQNRFAYTIMGDNVNLGSRLESLNKYYGTKILISDTTFEAVKEFIFCRQLDTIQVKGKSQAVTIYEPMGMRPVEFERRLTDRRGPMTPAKQFKKAFVMIRYGERRVEERRIGSERLIVKPLQEEIATMYEHALALYRKGDFDGAEMAFNHVLSLSPSDGPSRLMKSRIAKYRTEYAGAESHFDPVYKFDEK